MEQKHLMFELKNEWTRITPDVWASIQQKIAETIAADLLRELEGIPSPQGRLFGEIRDAVIPDFLKQGA